MTQRMSQVKGIDTVVEQFRPSRANPVARRAVRKYYAQQPVTNTSIFENLSFQIEQTDPKNVINEIRLIFPLELKAYTVNEQGYTIPLEMHTNSWQRSNNIAVAQNAPFSAFRNLEVAINGKIYTNQYQRYGRTLGQCFQSYSELSFQNDESLKPIANTFMGEIPEPRRYTAFARNGEVTGLSTYITKLATQPTTFSLLENNSGFIARSRKFQDGLEDDGKTWRGEISSLFHSGIFNSEARRQGNDQIPFVSDLYVNCVFETNPDILDKKYHTPRVGAQEPYQRTVTSRLFEFLTPMTAAFPGEERSAPNKSYPQWFELKWTAQPRIEIEWCLYTQPLLAPMYRLRGCRYQLEETLPFQVPYDHRPEDRKWVQTSIRRQLLAVPNLVYVWVEPTLATVRNSFCWGNMFRTLDIRNFKLRVNGTVDIMQDPSEEILYKWYKRNTSNVHEFPTWCKNKIICFSPSEVGMQEWLENDASVSTIDITLETAYSKLMLPEYKRLANFDDMQELGYTHIIRARTYFPGAMNTVGMGTENSLEIHGLSADVNSDYSRSETSCWFHAHFRRQYDTYSNDSTTSLVSTQKHWWDENVFKDVTWKGKNDDEAALGEFSVTRVNEVSCMWDNGYSYWVQLNPHTRQVVASGDDQSVVIWVTRQTHYMTPTHQDDKMRELTWTAFCDPDFQDGNGNPHADAFQATYPNDEARRVKMNAFWDEAAAVANDQVFSVYQTVAPEDTLAQLIERGSSYYVNYVNQEPQHADAKVEFRDPDTSNKLWNVAPEMLQFKLGGGKDWYYEENPNLVDTAAATNPNGCISQAAAILGWRWVKLTDPRSFLTDIDDSPFKGAIAQATGHNLVYPKQDIIMHAEIERDAMGSRAMDYTFANRLAHPSLEQIADVPDGDEDQVYDLAEFSLNMLLEYSNETVLMSQDRGKPVHISNLIAKGLPSQAEAYAASLKN